MQNNNNNIKPNAADNSYCDFIYHGRLYKIKSTHEDEYILSCITQLNSFYESPLLDLIGHLRIPEGVFIDVGSNIGNHSIYFAGEMGRNVLSFEMDSLNYCYLKENISINGLRNNIRAFNVALSDHVEVVKYERNYQNSGASKIINSCKSDLFSCQCIKLDSFLESYIRDENNQDNVALIKIDVEGHELQVLKGALSTIVRHKPLLVIELSSTFEFQRTVRFLADFGYVPVVVGASTDTFIFCQYSDVGLYNSLSVTYYARKYEKETNGINLAQLQYSRELDRIKSLLRNLYDGNRLLRSKLRAAEDRVLELGAYADAWESEASLLCGKIQKSREVISKFTIEDVSEDESFLEKIKQNIVGPEYITQKRARIKENYKQQLKDLGVKCHSFKEKEPSAHPVFRVALLGQQVSNQCLKDAVTDLQGLGIGDILAYSNEVESRQIGIGVDLRFYESKKDSIRDIMELRPFLPILILDLSTGIDIRGALSVVRSNSAYLTSDDIMVFDGLLLEKGKNKLVFPMTKPVIESRNVSAILSLNCFLTKVLWLHSEGDLPEITLSVSATRGNIRLILPPRQPVAREDNLYFDDRIVDRAVVSRVVFSSADFKLKSKIVIVGRVDESRWSRGGIYYSCTMYGQLCKHLAIDYDLVEIDQSLEEILRRCADAQVVFVYTGDQIAQDYYNVEPLVRALDRRGHDIVVNLSLDSHPERSIEIKTAMQGFSERVRLMVFTEDALVGTDLGELTERTLVVPKTIRNVEKRCKSFSDTEGLFLGDFSKFLNPRITKNAYETYSAIREVLPDAQLFFVEQYKSILEIPSWLYGYQIMAYSNNIHDHFFNCRLMLHSQNYCTFEMLPVEAAIAGIPVIYCDMPHSLNSYIGPHGVRFKDFQQMKNALQSLYNDESAWSRASENARGCGVRNNLASQQSRFEQAFKPFL